MTNQTIDKYGTKHWWQNDQLHRIDGPAIEFASGTKHWYQNNQRHRIDGPAIECISGYKEWYLNDQLHRLGGPAIEYSNGDKYWWQYDIEINPNIKINHDICKRCKARCHDEPKLANMPIRCKYELEHVVSNQEIEK